MQINTVEGIKIKKLNPRNFIIKAEGYGDILWVKLPSEDGEVILDTEFLKAVIKAVAIRTGKVVKKKR